MSDAAAPEETPEEHPEQEIPEVFARNTKVASLRPYGRMGGRSRKDRLRIVWALMIAVAPGSWRRFLGRKLLGWEVDPTATIGRSLIDARKVVMGPGSIIRSFTLIQGLEELTLGEQASIGSFNWISGPPLSSGAIPHCPKRFPALRMGRNSSVVSRHRLDCTDTITIGAYSVLAGVQTMVLTHSVDLARYRMDARPTVIGEFVLISARTTLLKGARVANRSIVASGSVVNTRLNKELTLYNGVPAVAVRDLPAHLPIWSPDRGRYA